MKAIELKGVSFSYDGRKKIFDNVSFSVDYGGVTLVSGHSGEGKSTLMYIVSGIIPNVNYGELTGEVLVGGEEILGRKMGYICRKVGVVLQNADEQIVQKIVEDEVAFGCENLAFPPEKIERQIEPVCRLMNLGRSRQCRTLSGGQKQRLITASTLAMGQKILILDEPLANLDKDGAAMLMRTLRSLAEAGYAVVVIEHRLDMVLPYVDTVWHVGGGRIDAVGNRQTYLAEQTAKIEEFFTEQFKKIEWLSEVEPDVQMIGVGGSFRNLYKINRLVRKYPLNTVHNYSFAVEDFRSIYEMVRVLDVEKRKRIRGLSPARADIMPAALAIIKAFTDYLHIESFTVGGYGLREGIMFNQAVPQTVERPILDVLSYSLNTLVRYYGLNEKHVEHTVRLSIQLFKQLRVLHKFPRV